jgi:predicted dehydrogenase
MSELLQRHLVVGLGSIGKRHACILKDYGCHIAGVEPYPEAQKAFDFPVFPSLEQGWAFHPDMVWVCSPTQYHAAQAIAVMEKNLALFIEKPLAHSLDGAKKIMGFYSRCKTKKLVWVGCNMRFHPAVILLKQYLEKGIIGRPLIVKIHFSHYLPNMRPHTDYRTTYAASKEGGGILLDDIHDIDLALYFSGPVKRTSGLAWKSGCLEMEAEDVAGIHLIHENRIFTQIQMDFLRKDKSRGIEIIGEQGTLVWQSQGKNPEKASIVMIAKNTQTTVLYREDIWNVDAMYRAQYDSLMQWYQSGRNSEKALQDAFSALQIALETKTA